MAATKVKYPDVKVKLTGRDSNVFSLMAVVTAALEHAGHADEVEEFVNEVTSSDSYHEALAVMQRWVEVS